MKKRRRVFLTLSALLAGAAIASAGCRTVRAGENQASSELIAGEDEKAPSQAVGREDMLPLYAEDIAEGVYDIEAETSSSMFRIVKAQLTVQDGEMTAVVTLGGKGYLKLFMGTGEEAVAAAESEYAPYREDAEGAYTYEIRVDALNQELECTGFSKKKEKWYDHQICFPADTLPQEAVLWHQAGLDRKDGEYTIEVMLEGGSGKAGVTSPAKLLVSDKKATAVIEWSSSNYDYMLVRGKKYLPVNEEGNSVFEIPVLCFDEAMEVVADTTAMSTPHEIAYTLVFQSDTVKGAASGARVSAGIAAAVLAAAAAAALALVRRRRKK